MPIHLITLLTILTVLLTSAGTATAQQKQVEYPTYFAHSNGISIAYQDFGNKDAEAILLVMGLGAQLIHWHDDFVMSLVDAGYRVVRFDNRDAGLSEKFYNGPTPGLFTGIRYKLGMGLGAPYHLDDMAADSIGLMDHLNIETAHVAGISMGGMIAQIMTANYPSRISSLASIMSTSGAEHLPPGTLTIEDRDREGLSRDEIIKDQILAGKAIYAKEKSFSEQEWYERTARGYDRSHYDQGFARQFWAIVDSGDRVDLLKTIKQPSVVIHGNLDPLIPFVHGEHTAENIPSSTFVAIDDMGHFMAPEHHSRVLNAVLANINKSRGTN